jgi:hypothetical protein
MYGEWEILGNEWDILGKMMAREMGQTQAGVLSSRDHNL